MVLLIYYTILRLNSINKYSVSKKSFKSKPSSPMNRNDSPANGVSLSDIFTPDLIDQNILYGQIFLQPTRTAEFIQIDFNILPTGASFNA